MINILKQKFHVLLGPLVRNNSFSFLVEFHGVKINAIGIQNQAFYLVFIIGI